MCQHCDLVERQQRRIRDADDNPHAYIAGNDVIRGEMQRIVNKAEAMAFNASIENEKLWDLYSVYVVYPGGNRRFYTEANFDKWFHEWADRSHSGG